MIVSGTSLHLQQRAMLVVPSELEPLALSHRRITDSSSRARILPSRQRPSKEGAAMDIHPFTHHDIARLRAEERHARALTAQNVLVVAEEPGDGRARKVGRSVAQLLQRIGRRQATMDAHARSNAT